MKTAHEILGPWGRVWNRLCLLRSFRQVTRPFVSPLDPDRWIFIIGCYNSGTTLLQRMLWRHPQIASMAGEGFRYTDVLEWPESYGWTRMWHRCAEEIRIEPGARSRDLAERVKKDWALLLGADAENVLEKSVPNAARVPFLREHFRPAYFVYLVRNGYAVAEGIRRKARPGEWGNETYPDRYPMELCARQWVESDRIVSRDAPDEDRLLTVYYEDLTEDPTRELRRIASWLGLGNLEMDPDRRQWHIHGRREPVRNMNPESFRRLDEQEIEVITDVAGECLEKHGYRQIRPGDRGPDDEPTWR